MTAHPDRSEPQGDDRAFQSVDWDDLSEKRDWAGAFWTTAAVLVILLGFVGGMALRTSLTDGSDAPTAQLVPEGYEVVPDTQHVRNAPAGR